MSSRGQRVKINVLGEERGTFGRILFSRFARILVLDHLSQILRKIPNSFEQCDCEEAARETDDHADARLKRKVSRRKKRRRVSRQTGDFRWRCRDLVWKPNIKTNTPTSLYLLDLSGGTTSGTCVLWFVKSVNKNRT